MIKGSTAGVLSGAVAGRPLADTRGEQKLWVNRARDIARSESGLLTCAVRVDHAALTMSAAVAPAQALRRWEAAMLVWPRSRARLRSVLRSAAINCGPVPVRIREASSAT
jgi:hypothetical protein